MGENYLRLTYLLATKNSPQLQSPSK